VESSYDVRYVSKRRCIASFQMARCVRDNI
jgi:hypothetical protein